MRASGDGADKAGQNQNHLNLTVSNWLTTSALSGWLTVAVKNRFSCGERLQIITPKGNLNLYLETIENLRGQRIGVAPGDGHTVRIPLPAHLPINEDGAFTLVMSHRNV